MYADYNFYENNFKGTLVPFEVYDSFNREASVFIDYITLNRTKNLEKIPDEVKMATCTVIEYMYRITDGTGITPLQLKSSESIGDYQVSYQSSQRTPIVEVETLYYQAAKRYLAHTGLLYRGG